MDPKPSSLAGPLWVVGIGLLILGMGIGFMAWVLWNKHAEAGLPAPKPPPTPEELRAMVHSNRAPQLTSKLDVRRVPISNYIADDSASVSNVATDLSTPPADVPAPPAPQVTSAPAFIGIGGGASVATGGSVIFGRVTFRGTPPPETRITVTDPNCGKTASPPATTRFYVISSNGGLADVFVYLRSGLEGRNVPVLTNAVLIDQRGCQYLPHVIGLQTGQPLVVRNSDQTLHNVHFTPSVPGNQEANRAQMGGGPDLQFTWPKPEVFLRLKCDVHPWMFSYIGVVDHPFFAVTDADGNFAISGVPPGRYVIEALHRKTHTTGGKGVQRTIEVKSKKSVRVDFEVTPPR